MRVFFYGCPQVGVAPFATACRTALGMTPGQYQKHYAAKVQALANRRDAIHAASLGR